MAAFYILLTIFLSTGLGLLTVIMSYLWLLAMVYLISHKHPVPLEMEHRTRFAIIVPAHNEEMGIAGTVTNLVNVCYPRTLFDVFVVADNCTDDTAAQARLSGAKCIIRHDLSLRGKGYALRYAFSELLPQGYDAFI